MHLFNRAQRETEVGGATKKFGEFDHKKKFLTVTPSFHRLLRSSPVGHVYRDPSVFPIISWQFSNVCR
jgi:hypothetical protein